MTVITQAFIAAARSRARALGLPDHPVVIVDHPIASMTRPQAQELARNSVSDVVRGLASLAPEARRG